MFLVSGTLHLVAPGIFSSLVPDLLPAHGTIIALSGIAELGCAVGLVLRPTRRTAGRAAAVLLVAVFPGNLAMALDEVHHGSAWAVTASLLRLPLQLPLIWAAWRAGRERPGPTETRARRRRARR